MAPCIFTNVVTEIVLGNNAVLDHYKLQHESTEAYHVGAIFLKAGRSANCASHSMSLGGALVRNDVLAVLDGEGGECTLNGLYLADGHRLIDNHTTIDHAMPHCGSREIYKGILADRARGVFNGKIIVRPDAQKTDAKQTNRALSAVGRRADQLEARARDLRQRRQVHARRRGRAARRGRGVLPAIARTGPGRGAASADSRFCGRRVEPDAACARSTRCRGSPAATAGAGARRRSVGRT